VTMRGDTGGCLRRARAFGWPSVAVFGFYLTVVGVFFLAPLHAELRTTVFDAAYVPLDLSAFALCAAAARTRSLSSRTRQAWGLLALGQLAYSLGDISWFVLEGVLKQDPYPSIADVGYLASYPLYFAGLMRFPVRTRSGREVVVLVLDIAVVVASTFLVMWYVALGRVVDAGVADWSNILDIAYPIADLVLVTGIAAVLLGGVIAHQRPLRWLTAGFATWVLADMLWNTVADTFTGGDWLDLVWLAALALIAIAADQQRSSVRAGCDERVSRAAAVPRLNPLPYIAVLASYVVILRAVLDLPFYPLGALLAADVLITVIVVVRQLLSSFDHLALVRAHQREATVDPLTGLANRRALFSAAQGLRPPGSGRPVSVVMLDLDRLKLLNDTYGHAVGDLALRAVAAACTAAADDHAVVARMGGDEFAMLLPDATLDEAQRVCDHIAAGLPAAAAALGVPDAAEVRSSVGICTGCDEPLEEMLRVADQELYRAKRRRGGAALSPVRANVRGGNVPQPVPDLQDPSMRRQPPGVGLELSGGRSTPR
jgi:diguanylate cyclase (GGDEF)-like protein